jgi:hypothetical protein
VLSRDGRPDPETYNTRLPYAIAPRPRIVAAAAPTMSARLQKKNLAIKHEYGMRIFT